MTDDALEFKLARFFTVVCCEEKEGRTQRFDIGYITTE